MFINNLFFLLGVFGLLIIASFIVAKFKYNDKKLVTRMRSWWVMIIIISVALLAGKYGMFILFVWLSYLTFNEFHRYAVQPLNQALVKKSGCFGYCLIALQYTWLILDWLFMYYYFIPCLIIFVLGIKVVFVSKISA